MRTLANWVEGAAVEIASDGAEDLIVDPSTEAVLASAPRSSDVDVDAAVRAARRAFEEVSRCTPAERQAWLLDLAALVEDRGQELAALEVANVGKPRSRFVEDEVPAIGDALRFLAGAARTMDGKAAGEYAEGRTSFLRREPVGVIGQIAPWNYPLLMAVWKLGAAVAAGNTVVLKPAEATPLSTLKLAELAAQVLPPGAFNVVLGAGGTGQAIAAHPEIDMVAFTGSVESGSRVAATAARTVKRVHLELGGNGPVVVFADADLDRACDRIAAAGFYNAGQDCVAAARLLVADEIHDEFVDGLARRAAAIKVGSAHDGANEMGPLITSRHRDRVLGLIERSDGLGEVVVGGRTLNQGGFFFEPTIVAGLRQDDELVQSEVFGPVVTVQRFDGDEEALRKANGTPFGLAASVWTRDVGRALRAAAAIHCGCVWINDHLTLVSEMPHGGVKRSGYGKDLGAYSVDDYTVVKHVMAATA